MYVLWKKIIARLHRIIDEKTIITIIQSQKQIINADSYPTCLPKIIAKRKRNIPNQNVTKIINLKYSQVGFVSLYILLLQYGHGMAFFKAKPIMNVLHLIIPIFELHEEHLIKSLHCHSHNLDPIYSDYR